MKKFETKEEAFASQNYNPADITITGVPEHHIEALKHMSNLLVMHDAVNEGYQPDYSNWNEPKYENVFEPGSPSGGGFRFYGGVSGWDAFSYVGARLASGSREAAKHVADLCEDDYKGFMVYERPSAKK